MLPAASRMRRSAEFEQAVRRGARSGTPSVVAHLARGTTDVDRARVGFVVARSVGNAVVRNRVKRRLREQVRRHLDTLPQGGRLVVRALPASADLDSTALGRDLDRAVSGAVRRLDARRG